MLLSLAQTGALIHRIAEIHVIHFGDFLFPLLRWVLEADKVCESKLGIVSKRVSRFWIHQHSRAEETRVSWLTLWTQLISLSFFLTLVLVTRSDWYMWPLESWLVECRWESNKRRSTQARVLTLTPLILPPSCVEQLYYLHRCFLAFKRSTILAIAGFFLVSFTCFGGVASGILVLRAGSAANVKGSALKLSLSNSTGYEWSVVFAAWLSVSAFVDMSLCTMLCYSLLQMKVGASSKNLVSESIHF